METYTIKVQRDRAPDADGHGGWKVTRFHRAGWTVVFRGDIAECHNHAAELAHDLRCEVELAE